MIELSRHGDVSLVCDVCRKPITVAGQAIVLRSAVGTAWFVHKGECDRLDERLWPRRTGWIELVELLDELRLAVGTGEPEAGRLTQRPNKLLRRIAEVAEAAYRRGFQQGHDVCRRGDRLVVDLDAWRYGIPLDKAPSPTGDRPTTAVERLDIQDHELVAELLMRPDPRDKQARGHGGRRGSR
jgi:hypothetical protein